MKVLEKEAAITAAAISQVGRGLDRGALDLTLDAILDALDQSGLSVRDIDGLATWPSMSPTPGQVSATTNDIKEALGLRLNWYCSNQDAAGAYSGVINAVMAAATGQARHVLCFRTTTQFSARQISRATQPTPGRPARRLAGYHSWQDPFNALSPVNFFAMVTRRRMHEFGLTKEQLGAVVLNTRKNAAANPYAVYRSPLTMDEYLDARLISDPLGLYDCDAPIDGAVAVIVSSLDAARDLKRRPLRVEAMSGAQHGRDSWDQYEDLTGWAATECAEVLWARTDLKPSDVDVANLYDGFSIQTLVWLEALRFCGRGESGPFVEGGQRIGLASPLPLNTGGGQLSAGRLHGMGLLWESCIQLWGEGGDRQVRDATVALTASGGGPRGAALLLVRE
jgi:acetyl-CoA acetyltransferase